MNFELGVVVKTTIALVLASLVSLGLRRASASTRHAVWACGLLAVLAFPLATKLLPSFELPILPAPPMNSEVQLTTQHALFSSAEAPARPMLKEDPVAAAHEIQPKSDATLTTSVRPWTLRQWVSLVWCIGSCVVFFGWVGALRQLRKLKLRSRLLAEDEWTEVLKDARRELIVTEPVQLRIAETPVPPMTWGIFHHVILLPPSALDWSQVRRRLVIAHEMAHVKRNDGLGQILAQAVCSIYWFNPMVWYAVHHLQTERERACDDTVLRLGAPAADYADHLVQIARGLSSSFALTAVSMAHPSQLKSRVQAILDSSMKRRRLPRLAAALLLCVVGALTLSAATIQVTALAGMELPKFKAPSEAPSWLIALVGSRSRQVSPPATATVVTAAPEHPTTATIEGIVQEAGSEKSIPAAGVELSRVNGGLSKPYTVAASAEGRFVFQEIPPGEYRLSAARNGYVRAEYGQRGPNNKGVTIALAGGQVVKDVRIVLTETAAISGHIYDRKGIPMANVQVEAMKYVYENGRRVLKTVRALTTDDEGAYRLYWLPPGQYLVMAVPLLGDVPNTVIVVSGDGMTGQRPAMPSIGATILLPDAVGNTHYFYPGTADPLYARPIDLRSGDDVNSIDLTLAPLPARTVRGKVTNLPVVTDAGGGFGVMGYVHLESMTPPVFDSVTSTPILGTYDKKSGAFEIRGVLPGKYYVVANASTSGRNAVSVRGRVSIEVSNNDVDNVTLTLLPGFDLTVRISIDGRPANSESPDLTGLRVFLNPDYTGPARPQSPGVFLFSRAQPADYTIRVQGLPDNGYVKSIRMGDTDGLVSRLHIERPADGPIEISIGLNAGVVAGTVSGGSLQSLADVTVAVVPNAPLRKRADLYKYASPDASGRFRFFGLPPGDYKLFAWNDVENGAWQDEAFIRKYEEQGKAFHIDDGSNLTIPVTVIP